MGIALVIDPGYAFTTQLMSQYSLKPAIKRGISTRYYLLRRFDLDCAPQGTEWDIEPEDGYSSIPKYDYCK